MKSLVSILVAVFFMSSLISFAVAEEIDDVFLDDGGMIDEPPGVPGEPVALPETDSEPGADVAEPAFADEAAPAEPSADEMMDEAAPAAPPSQPAKAPKAPKTAKVERKAEKKAEEKAAKKAVAAKASKGSKSPARKTASKEGFRTTTTSCEMHASPASASPVVLTVPGSKKLWIEEHDESWVKAFRKKGHGFLSRDCFE